MNYSEVSEMYPEFLTSQKSATRRAWKARGKVPWARVRDAEVWNGMRDLGDGPSFPPETEGFPRVVWTSDTKVWRIVELQERDYRPIKPGSIITWEQISPGRLVLEAAHSDSMGEVSWQYAQTPPGFLAAILRDASKERGE